MEVFGHIRNCHIFLIIVPLHHAKFQKNPNVDFENKAYEAFGPISDKNVSFWDRKGFIQTIRYCYFYLHINPIIAQTFENIFIVDSEKKVPNGPFWVQKEFF